MIQLVLIILIVILVIINLFIRKELRDNYYKDEYKKNGLSLLESITLLFNPEKFIKQKDLKKGYIMSLFEWFFLISAVMSVALLFGRI